MSTATARSKAQIYEAVAELHCLRVRDRTIAALLDLSATHTRRILNDLGLRERWHRPDDVVASLPEPLRTNLTALRRR
jgi:hypothetical protein